jgi:uncharacterized protein
MSVLTLHLLHHREPHVLASVAPDTEVGWDRSGSVIFSVSHTRSETSVICAEGAVPEGVRTEGPFHVFEVAGPLDFAMVGVLSGVLTPLAAKGVTVVTTSTYETDWILVPVEKAEEAERIWRREGFLVTPPVLGDPS